MEYFQAGANALLQQVELWEDGQLVRVEGDVLAGQPPMLLQPGGTIRTSWPCGANAPRKRIMN